MWVHEEIQSEIVATTAGKWVRGEDDDVEEEEEESDEGR